MDETWKEFLSWLDDDEIDENIKKQYEKSLEQLNTLLPLEDALVRMSFRHFYQFAFANYAGSDTCKNKCCDFISLRVYKSTIFIYVSVPHPLTVTYYTPLPVLIHVVQAYSIIAPQPLLTAVC